MPYIERPVRFEAWRTDGTEANAREIVKKLYANTYYSSRIDEMIRWKSRGVENSYFCVVVMVKTGSNPTEEWETEPGDYVVRREDKKLLAMSAGEFHDRFEEVDA